MTVLIHNIVSFSSARTHFSDLVLDVQNGAEKIITKNGEPAVAVIDARRLSHYHQLERANIHLLLLNEIEKGLADVTAGRTHDAKAGVRALREARKAKTSNAVA
jgi:prevent-host-death family protein